MIECANCGCQLDDSANFCLECGNPVKIQEETVDEEPLTNCPNCNSDIDENMKFCMICGLNLSQLYDDSPSYSKILRENSPQSYVDTYDNIKSKGNDVVHDNLPDSWIDKGKDVSKSASNSIVDKIKNKSNQLLNDNLPPEYRANLHNAYDDFNHATGKFLEDSASAINNIHEYRQPIKEQKRIEKERIEQEKWNERNEKILAEYDKLAVEFGLEDENYFVTSIEKYQLTLNNQRTNTYIDGFFVIKEDKFLFEEIGNRNFKKANTGTSYIYFDQIASMRITRALNDMNKYEDITKVATTSLHDAKRSIKTSISGIKAMRFKELITHNDGKGMFDLLIINLTTGNLIYEIRLPNIELGKNIIQLFEAWKNESRNNATNMNQQVQEDNADKIKKYYELYKEGIISEEEFKDMKTKLLS